MLICSWPHRQYVQLHIQKTFDKQIRRLKPLFNNHTYTVSSYTVSISILTTEMGILHLVFGALCLRSTVQAYTSSLAENVIFFQHPTEKLLLLLLLCHKAFHPGTSPGPTVIPTTQFSDCSIFPIICDVLSNRCPM